jgi:hypothetical protein
MIEIYLLATSDSLTVSHGHRRLTENAPMVRRFGAQSSLLKSDPLPRTFAIPS